MRPWVRFAAGWTCAALAATTVSWFAIRDVVATAAVGDPVPAGAVVAAGSGAGPTGTPGRTKLSTPTATRSSGAGAGAESGAGAGTEPGSPRERRPKPSGDATGRPSAPREPEAPAGRESPEPSASGDYQGYVLRGGQVVVAMRDDSASLVSAVPASGFETETWETDTWFRVDFKGTERRSSIIVAWNGTAPVATVTEF